DKLDKVHRDAEEVKTMLETSIKNYKQKLIEQGVEQGIEQGREEGRVTQARGYLPGLLNHFYTLSEKQHEQVLEDIKWIDSIDELNDLINICLDGKPFEAFRSLLDEMLDDV
ncbi:MAG: hypothetical protein AAF639_01540, partial [Chloroflexota bacterium]